MKDKRELERTIDLLVPQAKNAAGASFVPVTGEASGAAILTKSGLIFLGAAIENAASLAASICAERIAMACAVMAGETEFEALAVYNTGIEHFRPCGLCLAALAPFADRITIIVACDERMEIFDADLKTGVYGNAYIN